MVTNERRGRPLECRAERGSESKASIRGSISWPAMALSLLLEDGKHICSLCCFIGLLSAAAARVKNVQKVNSVFFFFFKGVCLLERGWG